ncbi:MAG: sugar ABC transporter permease [Candidatus Sumerlaeota bacterium]|nr:sugar ABC transporter permease [Candidatus Sumerlaeota bacterium]
MPRFAAAQALQRREAILAYGFLLPAFAPLAVFFLYPLAAVFAGSLFRDWGTPLRRFAGVENFDLVLGGSEFWRSLLITVYYVAGTAPVALALGFLIASLLHQQIRARGFYRASYFLPYITSTVAAAAVFRWIFGVGPRSAANVFVGWFGFEKLQWTLEPRGLFEMIADGLGFQGYPAWAGGPSLALLCVMAFAIWHMLGFNIVVFLAGLSAIPKELYEAAEVDGANWRQRTTQITLPLLSPTLLFLGLVSVIRAFQSFNDVYILTPVQRSYTTRNVIMLIYQRMVERTDFGYASAISFVLFLIILSLTLLQLQLFEKRVHYQ